MANRLAPFELLDSDFRDLIRRTFGDFGTSLVSDQGRRWAPALDIFTKDHELHVCVEMPGIDPDTDVEIDVTDNVLKISGQRRFEHEEGADGRGWWHRELAYGRFERAIALPRGVDASAVKATYDAGILDVVVPIPEKPTNKVKVEVGPGARRKELDA